MDTLSARVVEAAGPWPKVMRSRVAWIVVSAGSLPVTKHCCSLDALRRAIEIRVAGSSFPVRFSCNASNDALAMLSEMSASRCHFAFLLVGLGGDVVRC